MTEQKTSVLASLVAATMNTMEEKKTAARQLTPVAGETFPSDLPGAFMSKEQMHDIAKDLRVKAASLIAIADGLDEFSGFGVPSEVVDIDKVRQQKERAADARIAAVVDEGVAEPEDFATAFSRKADAAQAATFGEPRGAWLCPDHGKAIDKTSAMGRPYRGCPDCKKFQR